MSTRGAIGFRIHAKDKLSYNHSDSCPSGLGEDFVKQVRKMVNRKTPEQIERLKKKVERIQLVDSNEPVSMDIVERLAKKGYLEQYADGNVGSRDGQDWYNLLRKAQGNLRAFLNVGYMPDWNSFIIDSLFCEYAYILNLDSEKVEFYKGFQHRPHYNGRYGKEIANHYLKNHRESDDFDDLYYGCALIQSFPMREIPDDWIKIYKEND